MKKKVGKIKFVKFKNINNKPALCIRQVNFGLFLSLCFLFLSLLIIFFFAEPVLNGDMKK